MAAALNAVLVFAAENADVGGRGDNPSGWVSRVSAARRD